MKRLLDWLKKFNTPLCYGTLCVLFGVAFIVLPLVAPLALDVLLILAGVATVFIGILTVTALDTTDRGLTYYLNVGKTIALIAFGIFLITARSALANRFCLIFGVYVLVRAIPSLIKIIGAPSTSEAMWWVKLVISLIEITLGAWLIFYPKWPHILTGAMLLLVGIDVFVKLCKKVRGGTTDSSGTLYDVDFEDKS